MDTGFPSSDAQFDYSRARRRAVLSHLGRRLRGQPGDVDLILPFDEVVEALGRVGERSVGLKTIPLDSIVGTVGRGRDFDRAFRPVSGRTRTRWERIANAQRRGQDMPPISAYRIGDMHFVRDGHHRVSVARALGLSHIDAYVTEVRTMVGAEGTITLNELPMKSHERLFFERVPLPWDCRTEIALSDPWRYAELAEGVEAWGYRAMQGCGCFMTRDAVALAWFHEDFLPVVTSLREVGLVRDGQSDAEAYIDVVTKRYDLMRTHDWSADIASQLSEKR